MKKNNPPLRRVIFFHLINTAILSTRAYAVFVIADMLIIRIISSTRQHSQRLGL